jgi:hypothetical protein
MALTNKRCDRLVRKRSENVWGVADVIYGALESFVAKCEAETDLEKKIITFRPLLKDRLANFFGLKRNVVILLITILVIGAAAAN